jgi:uncharacterized protein with von Willebrand factor type A (vWA) domain
VDFTQRDLIKRLFGRGDGGTAGVSSEIQRLPRLSVEHDSVDDMKFGNFQDESPRFKDIVRDAPEIAPKVEDPPAPDFTTASQDEIAEWQKTVKANKAQRENAPPYTAWSDLVQDIFNAYHHVSEPEVLPPDAVDPGVAHHSKIAQRMTTEDEFAMSRNITRDNATASAIAAMGASKALKEALGEQLAEQAQQSQEFESERQKAENAMDELESLRDDARIRQEMGQPIPQELVEQIKQAVKDKRQAQAQAAQVAAGTPAPLDRAGHEAIVAAVKAGAEAAENAANIPSFNQGFGQGEPRYESPEQALTIADMWANNPILRAVTELYGRLDKDMRFKRARRVVGGADEIVDLKFGDDIRRILPTELIALADEDMEDDFFMRYLGGELRVYETVGEEQAGRGPICLCVDESGSMSGERNVWAKALALCLLNICRREKRDFVYIGFSGGDEVNVVPFPAKHELNPQVIVDMAAHFYGGGTTPVAALAASDRIMMDDERHFRKADVVMVTDGEASFGPEDKRLRDRMVGKGVRFHGIGIGGSFRYLRDMTEDVVDIRDFDLENPSEATAHLATHIS